MSAKDIQAQLEAEIDILADIEHERWSHWQKYMHDKGKRQSDGSMVIPAELVAQWDRQSATPFAKLRDDEKESDREQVRKYLPTVVDILTSDCSK